MQKRLAKKPAKQPAKKPKQPSEQQYQQALQVRDFFESAIIETDLFIEGLAVLQHQANRAGLRGSVCWIERIMKQVRHEQEWAILCRVESRKKLARYERIGGPIDESQGGPPSF